MFWEGKAYGNRDGYDQRQAFGICGRTPPRLDLAGPWSVFFSNVSHFRSIYPGAMPLPREKTVIRRLLPFELLLG